MGIDLSAIQYPGSSLSQLALGNWRYRSQGSIGIPLEDGISPLDAGILQPPAIEGIVSCDMKQQAGQAPPGQELDLTRVGSQRSEGCEGISTNPESGTAQSALTVGWAIRILAGAG